MRSSSSIPPKAPPTGFSSPEQKVSSPDSARAQVPNSPRVAPVAAIGSRALNSGKAPSLVTQPPTETPDKQSDSKKFDAARKATHDLLKELQKKHRIALLRTRATNNAVKNFYAAISELAAQRTDDSLLEQLFKLELIDKTKDERTTLALALGNDKGHLPDEVWRRALNKVFREFSGRDMEDDLASSGATSSGRNQEDDRLRPVRDEIKKAIAGFLEHGSKSALVAMSAAAAVNLEIGTDDGLRAAAAAEVNALKDTELVALHSFLHGAFAGELRSVVEGTGEPNLMLFTMDLMTEAVDAALPGRGLTAGEPDRSSSSSGPRNDATRALVEAFGGDWQASEEPQRPIAPARAPAGVAQLPKDVLKKVGALLPTTDLDALSKGSRAPNDALAGDLTRRRVKAFSDFWRARAEETLPKLAVAISQRNWHAVTWGLFDEGFSLRAAEVAQRYYAEDPRFALGFMVQAGRAQDALQLAAELLREEPVVRFEIYFARARAFLLLGYPVAAAADLGLAEQPPLLKRANEPVSQKGRLMMIALARAMTWHSRRHFDTAKSIMKSVADQMTTRGDDDFAGFLPFIAEAYAWMGDVDNAVAWMEKAMKAGSATLLPLSPFARNIPADNPLWSELRRAAEEHLRETEALLPKLPPPRR